MRLRPTDNSILPLSPCGYVGTIFPRRPYCVFTIPHGVDLLVTLSLVLALYSSCLSGLKHMEGIIRE